MKDLQKNKMLMHQNQYYHLWAVVAGILTPVLLGALTGHALGAFLWAVCARLTIVYHGTFCINSICHMFGKATYDIYATARDHWLVALITFGEGYHNYHHRFPSDYRNGVRWYQWDPSKWSIFFLSHVGFARDLKRVSDFRILEARLAGENQRATDLLKKIESYPALVFALEQVTAKYERLRQNLASWERSVKAYQISLHKHVSQRSVIFQRRILVRAKLARDRFDRAHRQWVSLIRLKPVDLIRINFSGAARPHDN